MHDTSNINIPEPGDIQISDPSYVPQPHLYRRALAILRPALPPRLDDDTEGTTARGAEAIEAVASLRTGHVEETLLADQFVVADAQANDVLGALTKDPRYTLTHWAAATGMMRQLRGFLSLLLRVQGARLRREQSTGAVGWSANSQDTGIEAQSAARSVAVCWRRARDLADDAAFLFV